MKKNNTTGKSNNEPTMPIHTTPLNLTIQPLMSKTKLQLQPSYTPGYKTRSSHLYKGLVIMGTTQVNRMVQLTSDGKLLL